MHSARMVQTTPRAMATLWSFRFEDEEAVWWTEEVEETGGWFDDEERVDDDEDGVDSDGDMEVEILVVVDAAGKIVNSSD